MKSNIIQNQRVDYSGKTIFTGIDSHLKSWSVSIFTEDLEHKTFTQPPKPKALADYLKRNFPGANYECCYEAGFGGFWIQEELSKLGVKCVIANPGDVPTTDKEKSQKRDPVDSRKLGKALRNGTLEGIYVPGKEAQMDRLLLRSRRASHKDLCRVKNRIKMMLHFSGVEIPEDIQTKRTDSKTFIKWLETVIMPAQNGNYPLKKLREQLIFLRNQLKEYDKEIKEIAQSERYKELVELLCSIPGISTLGAMIWVTEIVDMKRFSNQNSLNSYVGLVPKIKSSGEKMWVGELTHRGQKQLRRLLVQQTWIAIRKDPALSLKYSQDKAESNSQKAIIKAARRYLARIRHVWVSGEKYEIGIMK